MLLAVGRHLNDLPLLPREIQGRSSPVRNWSMGSHRENLFWKMLFRLLLLLFVVAHSSGQASEQGSATAKPRTKHRKTAVVRKKKDCRSLVEPRGLGRKLERVWRQRRRNPVLAYRIMILSSMSYYEFHKRVLPDNTTGFSLTLDTRPGQLDDSWRRGVKLTQSLLEGANIVSRFISKHRVGDTTKNRSTQLGIGHNITIPEATARQKRSKKNGKRYAISNHKVTFQYGFFNWYERGVAGVKFHDTDVLVSTMEDGTLIVAFAGTASPADAVTNIQTFEPANHSGFYHGGREEPRGGGDLSSTIQGSVHRGFLNALIRVDRGSVLRLCPEQKPHCLPAEHDPEYLKPLHEYFGNCTGREDKLSGKWTEQKDDGNEANRSDVVQSSVKATDQESLNTLASLSTSPRRKGGCKVRGKHLLSILQEVATMALQQGRVVHVTGHSLGGSLASHMALDLVVNYPNVPVRKLHLWTFGAPQIADSAFLESAIQLAPRLQPFVTGLNGRYHRYVTVSDECRPDVVSEVTKLSLPSHLPKGFHARAARTLGGVHSPIVHFVDEPHFLLTPRQFLYNTTSSAEFGNNTKDEMTAPSPGTSTARQTSTTKTHSTVAAHATVNYLQGISRESRHHPLQTDLPDNIRAYIGETL